MEAIIELQREGYQISSDGKSIKCRKLEGANPDPAKVNQFLSEIRNKKAEAIKYLRARFNYDRILDCEVDKDKPYSILLCPYKGIERPVHPAVCDWHRLENDPECEGCTPVKNVIIQDRTLH